MGTTTSGSSPSPSGPSSSASSAASLCVAEAVARGPQPFGEPGAGDDVQVGPHRPGEGGGAARAREVDEPGPAPAHDHGDERVAVAPEHHQLAVPGGEPFAHLRQRGAALRRAEAVGLPGEAAQRRPARAAMRSRRPAGLRPVRAGSAPISCSVVVSWRSADERAGPRRRSGGVTGTSRRDCARPRSSAANTSPAGRDPSARSRSRAASRRPCSALAVCRSTLPNCAWCRDQRRPGRGGPARAAASRSPAARASWAATVRRCSRSSTRSVRRGGAVRGEHRLRLRRPAGGEQRLAADQPGRGRVRGQPVRVELARPAAAPGPRAGRGRTRRRRRSSASGARSRRRRRQGWLPRPRR